MPDSPKTMSQLAHLVGGTVAGDPTTVLTDVVHDSRQAHSGALYVAMLGERTDGHDFAAGAVDAGASAVCVDHRLAIEAPQLIVGDTRRVIGELAAAVHDHPSTSLDVVGVTGTNGKTTVTHYVETIAGHAGRTPGLIGTIHTRSAGVETATSLTTPEASDFQRLLGAMRDDGVDLVAVEVSSHALEYGRVRGTQFAVAAFTNLSQDHLDFHGNMDSYRLAKERLFNEYQVGTAVINVDDPVGAAIAARYQGAMVTVGRGGDFSIHSVETHPAFSTFTVEGPSGAVEYQAPVVGEFNVANLVLACACCVAVGLDYEVVFDALPDIGGVPGRFQVVSGDDPITVIVDYAHTPEGVATAVETGRSLSGGRVIGLIGAGGDRDRAKRPAMGEAVSSADLAVITSDNPRSEDPGDIAAAVLSGLLPGSDHILEIDRRRAIEIAIDAAEDGDVVLILGRGHEPMQDFGSEQVPFDDRDVAAASLARRRRAAGPGDVSGSMST